MSNSMAKPDQEQLDSKWHNLLFGVRRSIRYHARRRMFFDRYRQFTSAIGVIFGSATIFTLLNDMDPLYPAIAAAVVTVFFAIDLVVGTAAKARLHDDLGRRFIELERRMELAVGRDEQSLAKFTAARLEIEADEPPVHRVLDLMCHNELLHAMGYERSRFIRIRFYQRWLAPFFDVQDHKIITYGELEQAKSK